MTRIAVVGGSGLESLLQGTRQVRIGTPYGPAPLISVGIIGEQEVAFLPRHGPKHETQFQKDDYTLSERVTATCDRGRGFPRIDG